MDSTNIQPLRVGIDISLAPWFAEIKYAFRTLLKIAGYPYHFSLVKDAENQNLDIFYGMAGRQVKATMKIRARGLPMGSISYLEPNKYLAKDDLVFLSFGSKAIDPSQRNEGDVEFNNDIIFSSYWLLTGAREAQYHRDRWDNLGLEDSFFLEHQLYAQPLVSQYGDFIRSFFKDKGHQPLNFPWADGDKSAVVSFTHDVDYPQIIKWVESVRLLMGGGTNKLKNISSVLKGTNHFWKFDEWVEFAKQYDTRPTFYFMARKGSLLQYALGTPDAFYDIFDRQFGDLFKSLKEDGCEVGLHPSYNSYSDAQVLKKEKLLLEQASQMEVQGLRHHYWHLNPEAPNETLHLQAQAGFKYDSTLGFEFYPGFRRCICHPFHPFLPSEKRELELVELPPAWMDDHFGRRLIRNGIEDPAEYAGKLVEAAKRLGGIIILDYHVRGMNDDFFPRYGKWLVNFAEQHLDSSINYLTSGGIVSEYLKYEKILESNSIDQTEHNEMRVAPQRQTTEKFEVSSASEDELSTVAHMHHEFFGKGEKHGFSIAKFGAEFLEKAFYRINYDNPYFFVDVAKYRGEIIAFSVYLMNRNKVFRYTFKKHGILLLVILIKFVLLRPKNFLLLLGNLRYLGGEKVKGLNKDDAHWVLFAVKSEFRSKKFESETGIWIAGEMFDFMERMMVDNGCRAWYAAPGVHNPPINIFMSRCGADHIGSARAQGLNLNYWRKIVK